MDKQVIISVGREYGSGGHYVAHKIANDLGIAYYDRSILDELAKEHNVSPEFLEKYDETKGNPLLSRRVKGLSNSIDEILVEMQFDLLRKKAASGESFVIVGRCAEELFRGEERLVSIFVVADMEDRVKNVAEQHKISPTEARAKIYRHDQGRKKYHNRYSSVKWGDSRGYDVCINSSRLGIEGTAKALEAYIAARLEQRKA